MPAFIRSHRVVFFRIDKDAQNEIVFVISATARMCILTHHPTGLRVDVYLYVYFTYKFRMIWSLFSFYLALTHCIRYTIYGFNCRAIEFRFFLFIKTYLAI